ncbi:MAG: hypothetical protein ACODAD_16305, partial [Planctomycetota bacterium]
MGNSGNTPGIDPPEITGYSIDLGCIRRGASLFFPAAANPNIELRKRARSLDRIYRSRVKSGIAAGAGGVKLPSTQYPVPST